MISTFLKLLFKKEFTLLLGRKYMNLVFLILIMFCSLLAIGISDGIKGYLSKKMQDPSVNFIMVEVSSSNSKFNRTSQREKLLKELNNSSNKSNFKYDDVSIVYEGFLNLNSGNQVKYRLVKEDDVFFERYVKKEIGTPESSNLEFYDDDYGCIITENLKNIITKNEIEKNPNYNFEDSPFLDFNMGDNHIAPIRILGVISALPNDNDLILTQKLFDAYNSDNDIVFDLTQPDHKNYLNIFSLNEITEKNDSYTLSKIGNDNFTQGNFYEVYKSNPMDTTTYDDLFNFISKNNNVKRSYDYSQISVDPYENNYIDYINFSFNNLDSVRVFKDFLKSNYQLKLDISTIEAKENFNLFDKISKFLSSVLVGMSIVLILSHLLNILMSHLDKNQKSIGTLKAFGLSNQKIILLYSTLSLFLISLSLIISYVCLTLISQPLMNFILNVFVLSGKGIAIPFQMFELYKIILFFVISPSVVVFIMLYNRINKSTPGDLIYKR